MDGVKLIGKRYNEMLLVMSVLVMISSNMSVYVLISNMMMLISVHSILLIFLVIGCINHIVIIMIGLVIYKSYWSILSCIRLIIFYLFSDLLSIQLLILINPLSVVGYTINTFYTIDQLDYYIPYLPIISLVLLLIDTNRIPIDLLEAESELIGGYQIEYNGFLYALLASSEYTIILVYSLFYIRLVIGLIHIDLLFVLVTIIVIRAGLPRLAYDGIRNMCLLVILVLALVVLIFLLYLLFIREISVMWMCMYSMCGMISVMSVSMMCMGIMSVESLCCGVCVGMRYVMLSVMSVVSVYMLLIMDVLCVMCYVYERYYVCVSGMGMLCMLYVSMSVLFMSEDMVSVLCSYEMQNVPIMCWMSVVCVKRGIGLSSMLLLIYGMMSGVLLYYGYDGLYVQYGVSSIGYLIVVCRKYVMMCVMMSGGVKLAMYPVNVWLSKVHVESPTIGSVLLAGISLKTGYYVQYEMISSISKISSYIYYYLFILIVGLLLYNIVIFYQIDTKRWIALYSILHINLYYLSLFTQLVITSFHTYLLFGLFAHSLISASLFLLFGYLSDLTRNKSLLLTTSLSHSLHLSILLLLLANSSFPLTLTFLYELLAINGITSHNYSLSLLLHSLSQTTLISTLSLLHKHKDHDSSHTLPLLLLVITTGLLLLCIGINRLLPIHYLVMIFTRYI